MRDALDYLSGRRSTNGASSVSKKATPKSDEDLHDSLFISDTVHERDIELPDGSVHTFRFRELSAAEFRRFGLAEVSGDDEKRTMSVFKLIAASVVNPDGSPAMTEMQAARLKSEPAKALFAAIMDINNDELSVGNGRARTSGSGT